MNSLQIQLIRTILDEAERLGLPLWLESGWAIDARLGRVTREHEDIDLAFPSDRQAQFMDLLQSLGAVNIEETDYGFLIYVNDILLDCEPCHLQGESYELEDTPAGSCPWEKQGNIDDVAVRCTSWEAILWEYFYYLEEVPQTEWRNKDFTSYALAQQGLGEEKAVRLYQVFENRK